MGETAGTTPASAQWNTTALQTHRADADHPAVSGLPIQPTPATEPSSSPQTPGQAPAPVTAAERPADPDMMGKMLPQQRDFTTRSIDRSEPNTRDEASAVPEKAATPTIQPRPVAPAGEPRAVEAQSQRPQREPPEPPAPASVMVDRPQRLPTRVNPGPETADPQDRNRSMQVPDGAGIQPTAATGLSEARPSQTRPIRQSADPLAQTSLSSESGPAIKPVPRAFRPSVSAAGDAARERTGQYGQLNPAPGLPAAPAQPRARQPAGPTVQITIGRIEVRAVQSPQAAPAPARPAARPRRPAMSLDDYLDRRNGKHRNGGGR